MIPLLENETIRLRATEPEDLELLYKWENDTEQWYLGSTTVPFSRYTLKRYLENSDQDIFTDRQLRLMIVLKEEGRAIGTIDLYELDPRHMRAAVGILIDEKERNKSYGFQSLKILEQYAFRFLHLKQLYAFIPITNSASKYLFEKAGYKSVGVLKSWIKGNGHYMDVIVVQRINLTQ